MATKAPEQPEGEAAGNLPSGEDAPIPETLEGGEAPAAPEVEGDPTEDIKAKYREALAHKHASTGAHESGHGDKGEAVHSQTTGPTNRMFRRKSGG